MGRTTQRYALVVTVGVLLSACGDDLVTGTETDSGTGTSGESTTDEPPPTTTRPTTTDPMTTDGTTTAPPMTTTTAPTTTETTEPDSTGPVTATTGSTTDTTSADTDTGTGTDTDTDTGTEVMGRSVSQMVNSGTVATSPSFRMVFTMGQPTQNQGVYVSPSFRLQGGLIGANGNPP